MLSGLLCLLVTLNKFIYYQVEGSGCMLFFFILLPCKITVDPKFPVRGRVSTFSKRGLAMGSSKASDQNSDSQAIFDPFTEPFAVTNYVNYVGGRWSHDVK